MRSIKEIVGTLFFSFFIASSCNPGSSKKVQAVHTVEIKQMKFNPVELTINEGDKVVFVNKDFVDHNITEEVKKAWSSSSLKPEDSWSVTIKKSATYYCSLHPTMKGSIIVK